MPKNILKGHELEFERTRLDEERTRLANERTSLAYLRTALSFIGGGLIIFKFYTQKELVYFSVFLIIIGAIFMLVGFFLFPIRSRRIREIRSKLNVAHYFLKKF